MNKGTCAEVELRIDRIINLIMNGATRTEIVRFCADEWNLADRQSDNYIAKAKRYIDEITLDSRKSWIAKARYRLEDLYKTARMKQDIKTCLSIIDTANKVLGYEKLSIEHSGSIDISDNEFDKLLQDHINEYNKGHNIGKRTEEDITPEHDQAKSPVDAGETHPPTDGEKAI